MKPHRVTIKYKKGEQTNWISKTVPAITERHAIDLVIKASGIDDANVISKKAELLISK